MNPFLRARDEALRLRQELLGEDSDSPIPSIEMLSRVENHLPLGIKEVPATSGVLKGGKATLRRSEGWIYCRSDESWPQKAYLIGHELGHYRLDPDVDEDTVHQGAEDFIPASPAAAYIEAYGARERDELQKNVFSRELLLPRQLARTMFYAGKGPRAIALALEIPLEVARQQVLDAVLLPPYVPAPPGPLPTPSADQQLAIDATEKHVNVVAGPGTGKTTTLIHRVKKLIEVDSVDPRKILVLTFTNKAAAELVDRLQRAGVRGASEVWAGTFHAFGLEFLRKYYQHFGVAQDVAVADRITQLTLTARALASTTLRYFRRTDDPYDWLPPVLETVLRVKEELVSIDEYLVKSLETTTNEDELAKFHDVATVARAYEKALKQSGMVDFVDLVAQPALAISEDRASFADVADRYQHVLIDEFQDLTSAMLALTSELTVNASLWVVGDVRQAIYHWRGASIESLLGFERRFASAKRYDLVMNRRSVQEVIDVTVAVGRHHPLQSSLPLPFPKCMRGAGDRKPHIVRTTGRQSLWNAVAQTIRTELANGIALREQVVIARKGVTVAAAAEELKADGVPVLYVGELLERPEIKDILAVVQLIVERSPRALLRVAELVSPKMPSKDVLSILESVARDGSLQRGGWLRSSEQPLSADGGASRGKLARTLRGLLWSTSPWDFFCELLLERRFLLADLADDSIDGHLRRLAQWQFAYMSRVGDGDKRRPTLFRLLNRLRLRQQIRDVYIDRELPPETNGLEGVRVMTLHSSKGLEFRAVHLVAVNGLHFAGASDSSLLLAPQAINSSPERYRDESNVEAHNLLYVAVSRAMDSLVVYEDRDEFPFQKVAALEGAVASRILVEQEGAAAAHRASAPMAAGSFGARLSVSNDEFVTYDRCPRQYLYRFGMEMGQELSPNPSLQARGLVKRTLRDLARSGRFDLLAETFEKGWLNARLPLPDVDTQLWTQASAAARSGADYLAGISGQFTEATADARGVTVGLPWGLAVKDVGGVRLHCADFFAESKKSKKRQDNILGQLISLTPISARVVSIELYDVTRNTARTVSPVAVYAKSTVSKRAIGLKAGDFTPSGDSYPCARCPYSYVCPTLPTV